MRALSVLCFSIFVLASCGGGSLNTSNTGSNHVANQESPALPANSASQTVNITSPDGVILVGTYLESPIPNQPALLLLHQWQSDRHSYDDFAKRMQAQGFNVLSLDGRGFGESTKTADGKTVGPSRTDDAVKAMLNDVGAAYDFLSKQAKVDADRIEIIGASYGSSLAIIYAANNHKVAAVALLSPGLNYFGNMQTEPAAKKYGNRPLLLVAAKDDAESADAVGKLKEESTSMCDVQIYDKGGHGTHLFETQAGLVDRLEYFLLASVK